MHETPWLGNIMAIDVSTEIIISRPPAVVAEFAANPDNAPAWYVNIRSVDWQTAPPLGAGTRVSFVARFMGRRMAYTYEVVEWVPGSRLVMRTSEGPFPMETTYTWEIAGGGGTRMVLRNRGKPSGIPRLLSPLLGMAVRRANVKDLKNLKQLLERPGV